MAGFESGTSATKLFVSIPPCSSSTLVRTVLVSPHKLEQPSLWVQWLGCPLGKHREETSARRAGIPEPRAYVRLVDSAHIAMHTHSEALKTRAAVRPAFRGNGDALPKYEAFIAETIA